MKSWTRSVIYYYFYSFFGNSVFPRGVFVLYLVHYHVTNFQVGVLETTLFATSLILEVPLGVVADRYGRKILVLTGYILFCITALGMVITREFVYFAILFALEGLAFAAISGADQAVLFDVLKASGNESRYATVFSRTSAISASALAIAIVVGGYAYEKSIQLPFVLFAGFSLVALLSFSGIADVGDDETIYAGSKSSPSFGEPWKEMLVRYRRYFSSRDGRSLVLFSLGFGLFLSATTPYLIFGQRLLEWYKFRPSSASWAIAGAEVVSAAAFLAVPTFMRVMSRKKLMLYSIGLGSGLIAFNLLEIRGLAPFLLVLVSIFPSIGGIVFNTQIQEQLPSSIRASGLSVASGIVSCSIAISYLAYGALFSYFSPPVAVGFSAVAPVCGIPLILLAMKTTNKGIDESSKLASTAPANNKKS